MSKAVRAIVPLVICALIAACAPEPVVLEQATSETAGGDDQPSATGLSDRRRMDVLIIADTYDRGARDPTRSISLGVISNMKFAEQIVNNMQRTPYVSVQTPVKVDGDSFNCDNIVSRVHQLDVESGDVVFVVYAGHGVHPRNFLEDEPTPPPTPLITDLARAKPVMPALYCTTSRGDVPRTVSSSSIVESIMSKSPHLLVFIIDSCNAIVGVHDVLSTSPSGEAVVENYPAVGPLFGRSAGTDIFVAASVSELAYYDANGGRFTEQMRDIIRRLSKSSKVTWGDVARELRPISTVDEQDKKVHVQSPYAVILP